MRIRQFIRNLVSNVGVAVSIGAERTISLVVPSLEANAQSCPPGCASVVWSCQTSDTCGPMTLELHRIDAVCDPPGTCSYPPPWSPTGVCC